MKVPFNRPVRLAEHETLMASPYLRDCLSGNGVATKSVETALCEIVGAPTRLVTSATHALEMMALLLHLQPGDEVILPSFTFVSTANAFALRGCRIRFADNDRFGNILPSEVARLANSKTKAVVAVHYAGGSADMDSLQAICGQYKLALVEDAAQAVGADYRGKALGTIGSLGCFSFHETKNITSGEGGAIIVSDPSLLERSEVIREKGTNRAKFLQGQADKYTWVDIGSSYVLSELNAAYLLPQVSRVSEINSKRGKIWNAYADSFSKTFDQFGIEILRTPGFNQPNYHMFAAIFPSEEMRSEFIIWMRERGIICPFHYVSLHTSPFGASFNEGRAEHLPGCERLSRQLVRFPLFYNLSGEEQDYVVDSVLNFFRTKA
jgi:dTDP-4-amino-4,6-dideoxygalactose transaminase